MLREILTTGFIDKNVKVYRDKYCTPGKSIKDKNRSMKLFNINSSSPDSNIANTILKPIMENKINIIMNRPDFFNNESTFQTTTNNPLFKSNEKTRSIISPAKIEMLSKNLNGNTTKKESKIKMVKNDINNNKYNGKYYKKDINDIDNIINEKKGKNISDTDNKNNKIGNSKSNSRLLEIDMSMLTSEGMGKIKMLEDYISKIKENSTNINELKIQKLQNDKNNLENNVNILNNNIILNKKSIKNNLKNKQILEQEKEKAKIDSFKANKEAFLLMKELPINRGEIELMKNQIAQAKEETKYINNYSIEVDGQTMEIQDEIKKYNVKISNIIKERDKITHEINSIKKKCNALKNKIEKVEKSSNDFIYNVGELAKIAQIKNK